MEALTFVTETFNAEEWDAIRGRPDLRDEIGEGAWKLRNFTMAQLTDRFVTLERQQQGSLVTLLFHPNVFFVPCYLIISFLCFFLFCFILFHILILFSLETYSGCRSCPLLSVPPSSDFVTRTAVLAFMTISHHAFSRSIVL